MLKHGKYCMYETEKTDMVERLSSIPRGNACALFYPLVEHGGDDTRFSKKLKSTKVKLQIEESKTSQRKYILDT